MISLDYGLAYHYFENRAERNGMASDSYDHWYLSSFYVQQRITWFNDKNLQNFTSFAMKH